MLKKYKSFLFKSVAIKLDVLLNLDANV
jgi:hypothetical protein